MQTVKKLSNQRSDKGSRIYRSETNVFDSRKANLHEKGKHHSLHWIKHPKIALKNATAKYNTLSKVQRDMIKNHMFPLTLSPPKTKAGWLICYYDKVSAIDDLLHSKNKRRKKARR